MNFIIQILLILRYKKNEIMKINFLVIVFSSSFFWFELSAGEIRILVSNIEEKRGTIHYGVCITIQNYFLTREEKFLEVTRK